MIGEPTVHPSLQRLRAERLPGELYRRLRLTLGREQAREIELRITVIGCERRRTTVLHFSSAPFEVGGLKRPSSGAMGRGELRREAASTTRMAWL